MFSFGEITYFWGDNVHFWGFSFCSWGVGGFGTLWVGGPVGFSKVSSILALSAMIRQKKRETGLILDAQLPKSKLRRVAIAVSWGPSRPKNL